MVEGGSMMKQSYTTALMTVRPIGQHPHIYILLRVSLRYSAVMYKTPTKSSLNY